MQHEPDVAGHTDVDIAAVQQHIQLVLQGLLELLGSIKSAQTGGTEQLIHLIGQRDQILSVRPEDRKVPRQSGIAGNLPQQARQRLDPVQHHGRGDRVKAEHLLDF